MPPQVTDAQHHAANQNETAQNGGIGHFMLGGLCCFYRTDIEHFFPRLKSEAPPNRDYKTGHDEHDSQCF